MIGYVMFGTSDVARARTLYDPLMAKFAARVVGAYTSDTRVWYGTGTGPLLVITQPYDGAPASAGHGSRVALTVPSRSEVDGIHALALSLGGADEGAPGLRTGTFYGAYFRDFDGNKVCVYTTSA